MKTRTYSDVSKYLQHSFTMENELNE